MGILQLELHSANRIVTRKGWMDGSMRMHECAKSKADGTEKRLLLTGDHRSHRVEVLDMLILLK